ncbi:MAG: hypothetical protein ACJ703_03430 [Nitrososphaera sp.]
MAGAIVTAAILLSGLSFIGSYPQAVAQESNMTGGMSSAGGNATSGGAASTGGGGNASMMGGAATGNQSSSDVRTNLEQARMALQNNDTQSANMYIDMALSALGGSNMTGATSGTEGTNTTTTAGGPTAGQGEGSGGGAAGGGTTGTSSQ